MQAVNADWRPKNQITTPLAGAPSYVNSGIIKAVMKSGDKISVGQIDYQEFGEENFQYVITPYWEMIDGLPASVFQGFPGIDLELRLKHYYRVNYIPTFIAERTPAENREDLWELLEAVGLTYYDRFEWLLRTSMRAANDNLIVERRRLEKVTTEYSAENLAKLQYQDAVIADTIAALADTTAGFAEGIFNVVTKGIDILDRNGCFLVDATAREALVPVVVAQRLIRYQELLCNRQKGIEQAKLDGKYKGRKPIEVDETLLRQIAAELDASVITIREAMQRTGLTSRSTFYRKLRNIRGN